MCAADSLSYAYGSAIGRAQGIGILQEQLARLKQQYITSSNSSVNYTITDNAAQFPLGQRFYMDMSHDDILISYAPPRTSMCDVS